MSLFTTLSDMSKQHAENSGSYKFGPKYKNGDKCVIVARIHGHYFDIGAEVTIMDVMGDYSDPCPYKARFGELIWFVGDDEIKLLAEPKPAPTVSLYNLLDHSPSALRHLRDAIRNEIWRIEKEKLTKCDTYTDLCAFAILIDAAYQEAVKKEAEAWAEKTAKEINETTK